MHFEEIKGSKLHDSVSSTLSFHSQASSLEIIPEKVLKIDQYCQSEEDLKIQKVEMGCQCTLEVEKIEKKEQQAQY